MNALRTEAIARSVAAFTESRIAVEFARSVRAIDRAAEKRADFDNLVVMLAQPGRRPDAATITKMGRAAKASAAEIAAAVAMVQS